MTTVALGADAKLVDALRRGDERAMATLVDQYQSQLLRLARTYVRDRAVAEEVVQETWLAVLQGLDRFEQRSLLKTWIFRILVNRAKSRGVLERRSVPFSSLASASDDDQPAVDARRFDSTGHWTSAPRRWSELPEERLLAGETRRVLETAIGALPPAQAQVITLRDVEGWSAPETCTVLGISEANQRVLLHRARSKVRAALEQHLG